MAVDCGTTDQAIISKKQQKAKADTAEARAKKDLEDAQVGPFGEANQKS